MNLTSWEAASDLVRSWEASGEVGVTRAEIPTAKGAVGKYIADGESRNLGAESVKKMRDAVERLFLDFCAKQGYRLLSSSQQRPSPRQAISALEIVNACGQ